MAKYNVWWQGVGEVMIGCFKAKSHQEVRKIVMSQIVIRKVKEK